MFLENYEKSGEPIKITPKSFRITEFEKSGEPVSRMSSRFPKKVVSHFPRARG